MTRTKTNATTTRAFLSVQEVAALLGEHRSTCYRSIERGDFPIPVVTINGRLRVPRRAVERLIAGDAATFGQPAQAAPGADTCPVCGSPLSLPARRHPMCSAARRSSSSITSV
jgi:excisionase family DNA binding protein